MFAFTFTFTFAFTGASSGIAVAGADELPSVLVLPVGGAPVLEGRVVIALGQRLRGRAFAWRDVPEARRGILPSDPTACLAPDCVQRLGRASGAARVLSLEFLGDAWRSSLFATLFDGDTGAVLKRREFGALDPSAPPAALPGEIASWARGEPPLPPSPPRAPHAPPLVALELAPGAPAAPGEALLSELAAVLARYSGFSTVRGASSSPPSWRAQVAVESASVTTRPHHLHHYRDAVLIATLTIRDSSTHGVVFARRAQAELSERSKLGTDEAAMAELVRRVAVDWQCALDAQSVEQTLARRIP
ncbi:MAG TPA: hypothetical protein VFF06_32050 [Polyangia bacterium]|nr:hypothetical protein [Polyangia bacterium]